MAEHGQSSSEGRAHFGRDRVDDLGREYVSAEVASARAQAELDRISLAWDFSSRISTARGALKRGMPVDRVREAHGETILAAAIEPET